MSYTIKTIHVVQNIPQKRCNRHRFRPRRKHYGRLRTPHYSLTGRQVFYKMNSWLNLNISAAKNALRHLLKRPLGTLMILLMTGIALTLPLCLYLAVQSTQNLFGSLSSNPQITVYLQHNANANDIAAVKQALESDKDLSNVKLIDKTAALQEIQSSLGDADIVLIWAYRNGIKVISCKVTLILSR